MATSEQPLTATIIYGYAWDVDMVSKETLSYTKTYTNTPGTHNVYDVVVNSALPSPSRFETVGIHFTMAPPGGVVTHPHLATVATSRPTRPFAPGATHGRAPLPMSDTPTAPYDSKMVGSPSDLDTHAYSDLARFGFALGMIVSIAFLLSRMSRAGGVQLRELKHPPKQ